MQKKVKVSIAYFIIFLWLLNYYFVNKVKNFETNEITFIEIYLVFDSTKHVYSLKKF